MAGGLRYKFHGSQIQVLVGFGAESPPLAITNITSADPPVVTTSAAHGLSDGDVVFVDDVVGTVEANQQAFIIENASGDSFELADTKGADWGAYVSDGSVTVGEFSNLCELTNYNRTGGTSAEIPATSVCSTAKEYEIDLPDFGTTQLSFNFAPKTTVQGALHDHYLAGDPMAVKIVLPKEGGTLVQLGFVQQETETAGVGGIWTATATVRNTGNRFDMLEA